MQWSGVPCAASYEVLRATAEAGPYTSIGTTAIPAFDDTNNQDTVPYYYEIVAESAAEVAGPASTPVSGWRQQGYVLVTSWGSSGTGDGQFSSPYNLAVDGSSNVYVLDTYNQRVQKFEQGGTFLTAWGAIALSSSPGDFYYPKAITVVGSNVLVGDDLGNVQKFDLNGTYVSGFSAGYDGLSDVATDASGNIYLTDADTLVVETYNSSYTPLRSFGGSGSGNGQFSGSIMLAVDAANSILYVSDNGHDEIQYFTLEGTYGGAFGQTGSGPLQFQGPGGVAVDAEGSIYIADYGNNRVQKVTLAAGQASVAATFSSPDCGAIAVDASGYVYVLATTGQPTVSVYKRQ